MGFTPLIVFQRSGPRKPLPPPRKQRVLPNVDLSATIYGTPGYRLKQARHF